MISKNNEFELILQQVAAQALATPAQQFLRRHTPFRTYQEVLQAQQAVLQASDYLGQATYPDLQFGDLEQILARLQKGAELSLDDLLALSHLGNAVAQVLRLHFPQPVLAKLQERVTKNNSLERCRQIFNASGILKDDASPELARLNQQIRQVSNNQKEIIDQIIAENKTKCMEPTARFYQGIYLLPLKVSYKDSFGGIIHDYSATGQTCYVEPARAFAQRSHLNQLLSEKKKAIAALIKEIVSLLTAELAAIEESYYALIALDMVLAKAAWGIKNHYTYPVIKESGTTFAYQLAHPFLDLKKVVRNDFQLTEQGTIIISGPNAGGKTVFMKSVALFFLLAQCGLAVPATGSSELVPADGVYLELGDDQSLSDELSSFAAHLKNIKTILDQATAQSLVLIDELARGTDPRVGEALAIAIIEELQQRGIRLIVSTHLTAVRHFALLHQQAASMEFNQQTLLPTYRLNQGTAGPSYALELASRAGISPSIIARARAVGAELMSQEEQQKGILEEKELLLTERQKKIEEKERQLLNLQERIAAFNEEKRAFAAAQKEAVAQAVNEAVAQAQAEIKKKYQELTKTNLTQTLAEVKELAVPEEEVAVDDDFAVNDYVLVSPFNLTGVITSIKKNNAYVTGQGLNLSVPLSSLTKKKRSKAKVTTATPQVHAPATLNIIGWRREKASEEVATFIDRAMLGRLGSITIIHGSGSGVLRTMVQELARARRLTYETDPLQAVTQIKL